MKKMIAALTLVSLFLLGCQSTMGNKTIDKEGEDTEASVLNKQQDVERTEFDGYWTNGNYTFYIGETAFYIHNLQNNFVHSYNFTEEKIEDNVLTLSIKESREPDSISLLEENQQLFIDIKNEVLHVSDLNLKNENFSSLPEAEVDERFVAFVETDGEVGQLAYQGPDLKMEDFNGYWVPMDKFHHNDEVLTPLGNYTLWIQDEFTALGYYGSFFEMTHIQDFEITGNSLATSEESLNGDEVTALEEGYIDQVERNLNHLKYTLFQEDDRDRLVLHGTGFILQRATTEEIIEHFGYDNTDKFISFGRSDIEAYNGLTEDQYYWTEATRIDDAVKAENYPYSVGELSELTLFREKQIIDGVIPHPREDIDEEAVISKFFSGGYENTPSYLNLDYYDTGYYFSTDTDTGETTVTIGVGGRTHWGSTPMFLSVESASFEENIITVTYWDGMANSHRTDKYFRISDDVMYTEDSSGNFTNRYATDTDWNNFHNLPKN